MVIPERGIPRAYGPVARRVVLPAVLALTLAGLLAVPAQADPTRVPDAGARPTPAGELRLPDGRPADPAPEDPATPPADDELGPLAAEISQLEMEVATAAERLKEVELELAEAQEARRIAEDEWKAADAAAAEAKETADKLVAEAYRGAAAVPDPLFVPGLRDFWPNAPVPVEAPVGLEGALRDMVAAEEAADRAMDRLTEAIETEEALREERDARAEELADLEAELEELRERNADRLEEIERERDEANQRLAPEELIEGEAHPDALAAVEFALAQRGKPYQWGAEGPDRYDCSGLVWAAYRSVGITLPRVAADQYWATRSRPVPRSQLLPGDLVFFSSDPANWRAIGHVGMYVGDGRIVHAPRTGDVVKVQEIWWSNFFGATRVIDAVPGDEGAEEEPPEPPARPSPSPTPPPPSRPTTPPPTGPSPSRTPLPATTRPTTPPPPSPTPPRTPPPSTPGPSAPPPSSPAPGPTSPSPSSRPTTPPPPRTSSPSAPSPSAPASGSPPGPAVSTTPSPF